MPRFGHTGVRRLWCMEPRGGVGGSPSRGGVHQRRLTPSDRHGHCSSRWERVRVGLALCLSRGLYQPRIKRLRVKHQVGSRGSAERLRLLVMLVRRGQAPLMHSAEARISPITASGLHAPKGSDPGIAEARHRLAALRRVAAVPRVSFLACSGSGGRGSAPGEAPSWIARVCRALVPLITLVRRGQTPLMHSAPSSMSPFNVSGLHAPTASDPGNAEARHRLASLRRIAAVPRVSFFCVFRFGWERLGLG